MNEVYSVIRPQGDSQNPSGYDELPESIKTIYSPLEYAWLSDGEKASLIERETEPETD